MRPGRLAVLVGTLVATGALYLRHLAVDAAAFRSLTGVSVPTIWQELGKWGRPAAVLLAAALVASSFRPASGQIDRVAAVCAALLATGAVAAAALAWQAAATDAAIVAAALRGAGVADPGASAGRGFWPLVAGAGGAGVGALWDLITSCQGGGPAGPGEPPSVGEEDAAAV